MANASEPGGGGGGGGGGEAAALGLKLATLSLLLCVSLAGNVLFALLIVRERSLHRAPYYLLLDLCLADGLRALACLPAVMLAARRAAAAAGAPPGALGCKLLAFLAALFCFHAAFLLLGVGVTRYLAIAHHRFYAERLAGWPCAAMLVCAAWALALAAAFPPVLDGGGGGGGGGDDEDAPCALEQRPDGAPGALGFLLLLAVVVGATHLIYLRLLFFIHDRRKMRPARLVPAVSHDWTFHGPGATGQAAANWTAGFGRGPTPPALVGIRPAGPGRGARRLLVLEEFKTEKRLCKMFYAVTLLFLLLWGPYVVASYLRVLVRPGAVPQAYLTASVWLTFAQAGINPVVCFLFNRELRDCFRAQFPCCQSPQTTQATLPCDLKGIGL
ncbi:probable G-protein coupled receptor 27 [Canis lupus familiaris]|uniref:probable G-protein coupled receptor 27 n=1 Tax=Canis lupus familiaris TaxID=9615 RepID=UPI0018F66049|nr:probable G-protein coupled receptor 27 [Canis lupus familiaris]